MLRDVRARTLGLVGFVVAMVGLGAGATVWSQVPDDDAAALPAFAVGGATVVALVTVVAFLAGWFGRERDDVVLVAVGAAVGAALVFGVGSLLLDDWRIGSVLIGLVIGVVAGVAGQVAWRVGDTIADLRGLPTMNRLLMPAFPDEYPGQVAWTTEATPALRRTLDELAATAAPGTAVSARAIGIRLGLPRDLPVAVVLAGDRLAIAPITFEGSPSGDRVVLDAGQLAEVSIRSLAADGSTRRRVNAYDDVIDLRTSDGRRVRLRLAYGRRGTGSNAGGPDEIREWLRTNAAAYR